MSISALSQRTLNHLEIIRSLRKIFTISANAEEFLYTHSELADILKEAKHRVILSRCYYAAFHLAKEFVMKHHLESLHAAGEHDRVIFYLKHPAKGTTDFKRSCIRLSNILNRLKKNRVLADYERDAIITELDVMDQINKTDELILEVKRLS